MALDQEDREWISSDFASLCRYEAEEAISGRKAEHDVEMFGYRWASADRAKRYAEQRLLILPSLGIKNTRWEDHYVEIRDCIKRLDAYIAEQVER